MKMALTIKRTSQQAVVAIGVLIAWRSFGQTYDYDTNGVVVQTFAGSGFVGYLDGTGQQTMFGGPSAIVADSRSNLFVWDSGRIRKITPDAAVSTFAGGGSQTTGIGTNVSLPAFESLAIDNTDTLWAVKYSYLYRITTTAQITRFYLSASISDATGVTVDSHRNVYISDSTGHRLYRYSTNGVLSVFAGSGNQGNVDGNGVFTSFDWPTALAADAADNIYVWDSHSFLVRRIDQS